jgi:predicted DNA-binding transcriptional regulator AlpA
LLLREAMKDHKHVGIAEIAERLGVSRQRVHQLVMTDPTFPPAADDLTAGKVWHETDVLPWIEARLRSRP